MSRNIRYSPENPQSQKRSWTEVIHGQCCGCIFGIAFTGLAVIVAVGLFLTLERPRGGVAVPNPYNGIQKLFCDSAPSERAAEVVKFNCAPGTRANFP